MMNAGQNAANTRMTYGRFLDYLEAGRVIAVDLYDNGQTAIVEALIPNWTIEYSAGVSTCLGTPQS
jgi:hypothetical protein